MSEACCINGCGKPAKTRELCVAHYHRFQRHGDPLAGRAPQPRGRSAEDRFLAKVTKDGPVSDFRPDLGKCWLWLGGRSGDGRGRFFFGGKLPTAHSASYQIFVGMIADGLEIDHLCRNPICVNPAHLEAVSHKENMARGFYGKKTHCPKGHAYTGDNLYVVPRTGGRQCRVCKQQRERAWRGANHVG